MSSKLLSNQTLSHKSFYVSRSLSYDKRTSQHNNDFNLPTDKKVLKFAEKLLSQRKDIVIAESKSNQDRINFAKERALKKYAYHTTVIENVKYSPGELKKVIKAHELISNNFEYQISEEVIRQVNGIFMNKTKNNCYRREAVVVQGTHGDISKTPHYKNIPVLMNYLVKFANENRRTTPLIMGPLVKAHLVRIHPFNDGNGRTSRVLLNCYLTSIGFPHIFVPTDEIDVYYTVIKEFINRKRVENYFEYVYCCIERSIELYLADLKP